MISIGDFTKRVGKLAQDNSPAILTAVGVAGTLSTAFLTGRASYKAAQIIAQEEGRYDQNDEGCLLTSRDRFELVWRLYVPPACSAALTVAAIIFACQIGTRRAAAMAAAYTISEKAFAEYREKVVEKIGANKERQVRDELAQDRVTQHPPGTNQVFLAAGGNVLCHEAFTGRYFRCDIETLRQAQNTINYRVLNDSYASLTDFYNLIGLPSTTMSDDLGWNSDDQMLDLIFSAVMAEDGQPAISVEYRVKPIRNYWKFG